MALGLRRHRRVNRSSVCFVTSGAEGARFVTLVATASRWCGSVAPVLLTDRPESWQTSAVYLAGLSRAIRSAGLLARVLPRLSAATKHIVENPYGQRWHPALYGTELATAVLDVAGPQALEDLTFALARESFGPILGPTLKVALALSGAKPTTVFARIDQSIRSAVQGVSATWTPSGEQSGAVCFEYPMAAPRFTDYSWRGGIRFMFHLVGVDGSIAPCERLEADQIGRAHV